MSRSRLDEIVEEVLREKGAVDRQWHLTEFGLECEKAIAERAFRHGVERATDGMRAACNLKFFGIEFDTRLVQPAPAEEKRTCGPHPWFLNCDICGTRDRRKGERRKVCRRVLDRQIIIIKPDRRSGKGRRK